MPEVQANAATSVSHEQQSIQASETSRPEKIEGPEPSPVLQEDNGPFERQESSPEPLEMDSLRERLHTKMMNAHDSGELADMLGRLSANPPDAPSNIEIDEQEDQDEVDNLQVEDLRQKLHGKMLEACASGTLVELMTSLAKQTDGEEPALEPLEESGTAAVEVGMQAETLQDSKQKAQMLLEAARKDGTLDSALVSVLPPEEQIFAKLRKSLSDAADDGRLKASLNEMIFEEIEKAKPRLQSAFFAAAANGDLKCALQECAALKSDDQVMLENVRATFSASATDGRLISALKQLNKSKDSVAAGSAEVAGADSQATPDPVVEAEEEEPEIGDLREKMAFFFEEAADSGALADILSGFKDGTLLDEEQEVQGSKPSLGTDMARQESEESLEDIRLQMKGMLEEAVDSGLLAEALGSLQDEDTAADRNLNQNDPLAQNSTDIDAADEGDAAELSEFRAIRAVSPIPPESIEDEDLAADKNSNENDAADVRDAAELSELNTIRAISPISKESVEDEDNAPDEKENENDAADEGDPAELSEFKTIRGSIKDLLDASMDADDKQGAEEAAEMRSIRLSLKESLERDNLEQFVDNMMEPKTAVGADSLEDTREKPNDSSKVDDEVRTKAKAILLAAADDGSLRSMLAAQMESQAAGQAKAILLAAADDGSLRSMLTAQMESQAPSSAVEGDRKRLAGILKEANDSGALDSALARVKDAQPRSEAGDLEDIRKQMKDTLQEAHQNGSLGEVLASAQEVEDIRLQIKDTLAKTPAEDKINTAKAAAANEETLEELRLKARGILVDSGKSGKLDALLSELKRSQAGDKVEEGSLEDIRLELKEGLKAAYDSGELCLALKEVIDGKMAESPSKSNQDTCQEKEEVRLNLLDAAMSGKLDAALSEITKAEAPPQPARSTEDAIRSTLLASCQDGSLDAALAQMTPSPPALSRQEKAASENVAPETSAREWPVEAAVVEGAAMTASRELPFEATIAEVELPAAKVSKEDTSGVAAAARQKVDAQALKEKAAAEAAAKSAQRKAEAAKAAPEASKQPVKPVKPAAAKPKYSRNAKAAKGVSDKKSLVLRVTKLFAQIKEAKEHIEQRDKLAEKLEGRLSEVRQQVVHLERDLESHKRALQDADKKGVELEVKAC